MTSVSDRLTGQLAAIDGAYRPHLLALLDDVTAQLERIGSAIGDLHFATGPRPRPFGALPALVEVG